MFIIYGMPNCVWCDRAWALLRLKDFKVDYRLITEPEVYDEMKEAFPEAKTVPQILWVGDGLRYEPVVKIGGYEQLREYLK